MNIERANYFLGNAIRGFQDDEISGLLELSEATKVATPMECMECGHKFKRKIGPRTVEVKCPKCGSYDTDLA